MKVSFSRFVTPNQNLSPREEREEEKIDHILRYLGVSGFGFFLPERSREKGGQAIE